MQTVRIAGAILLVVALIGMSAVLVGSALWERATRRLEKRLTEGERRFPAPAGGPGGDVPGPVARFLRRALPADGRLILAARIVEEGSFQMGEGESGWRPFRADHHFRAYPPGFLWDARIAMAPLMTVRVRDYYLDGEAGMLGRVGSVFTVVNASGTPELASGALYRYLAEAPWLPSRLMPGEGLAWRAEDEGAARATLEADGHRVELLFRFTPDGDVCEIYTPARPREVGGTYVETPWVGRFRAHEDVNGFRVPREGEVAWVLDGVEVPYWRGRLTSIAFDVTR